MKGRDLFALMVLAAAPLVAHGPAWWDGRLLGPGDGAMLHYPLRSAVWESYRHGDLPSWNPRIFSGAPLLASYRPGALYPPMVALSLFPPFFAFQCLVLLSLAAAGGVTFLLLRRLGAGTVGAYAGGLFYSLGPYLVGHLGDTATIVAAPLLPLTLLGAEGFVARPGRGTMARFAGSLALLLLAGSPDAARAGLALSVGRLVVALLFSRRRPPLRLALAAAAILIAFLLAGPQLVPTLLATRDVDHSVSYALKGSAALPGLTGLALRYLSHTPAPALVLAAAPLVLTETPILVSAVALLLCLGLQFGRGPLQEPGALALVFDFTLCLVAALSLGAQWEARMEARGRRLRAHWLLAALASVGCLSASAALLGPLPQALAGAVGVLAVALILYFALAASPNPMVAGLWLLPLTVSFLLQPGGRGIAAEAPREADLLRGTPTRMAVERALARHPGRVLTLLRTWPRGGELDLAFPNIGSLTGRASAGGYDPWAPLPPRELLDGMSPSGTLSGSFFRSDPLRLEAAGITWLQLPASSLVSREERPGLGEALELRIEPGHPRFLPTPFVAATEIRLASALSDAVGVVQGQVVAKIRVRLGSGQEIALPLRAGIDTAEWAYDRPDVRFRVAHKQAEILESFRGPGGAFQGHRYRCVLPLGGRFYVDGFSLERANDWGALVVSRAGLFDAASRRSYPVSLPAAFVSDTDRLREVATTPAVRLFEVVDSPGLARVVSQVRTLESDELVLEALREPKARGIDPYREAVATRRDAGGLSLATGSAPSPGAVVVGEADARFDVRAEGPGLLVLAESWDRGWSLRLDGHRGHLFRVEHARMGVALGPGTHVVELQYEPPGFRLGLTLAGLGAVLLAIVRI